MPRYHFENASWPHSVAIRGCRAGGRAGRGSRPIRPGEGGDESVAAAVQGCRRGDSRLPYSNPRSRGVCCRKSTMAGALAGAFPVEPARSGDPDRTAEPAPPKRRRRRPPGSREAAAVCSIRVGLIERATRSGAKPADGLPDRSILARRLDRGLGGGGGRHYLAGAWGAAATGAYLAGAWGAAAGIYLAGAWGRHDLAGAWAPARSWPGPGAPACTWPGPGAPACTWPGPGAPACTWPGPGAPARSSTGPGAGMILVGAWGAGMILAGAWARATLAGPGAGAIFDGACACGRTLPGP